MIVRQWCLPVMLLLGAAACSKNTATPATNERTAMDAAAAKAVNDTDAALRDAAVGGTALVTDGPGAGISQTRM